MQGVYISHEVRNPEKLMEENQKILEGLITNPEKKKYDQENIALAMI